MKVFIGILLATTVNFMMGLLGLYVAASTFVIGLAPNEISTIELSTFDYLFSFCLKFFVILVFFNSSTLNPAALKIVISTLFASPM